MFAEGIIAMVWAAAGMSFYEDAQALLAAGAGVNAVVYEICRTTLGKVGSVLAILGVIACPITSGDTAYRSARLTIADWVKLDQKPIRNRLIISIPLLAVGVLICQVDYSVVWRYFSWSNQTLAMIMLWAAASYLNMNGKKMIICVVPATFMTAVTMTYFMVAPECMGILWNKLGVGMDRYYPIAIIVGIAFALLSLVVFLRKTAKRDFLL